MNVNTTYVNILQDNNQGNIQLNYKRRLKELLLQNISNIEFIKPVKKNEPEKICSTKQKDEIVDSILENINSNYHDVFQAARLIRDDVLRTENWKFTGSSDNYQPPFLVKTCIRWIISGPSTGIESERRTKSIDIGVDNLTQIVAQAVKMKRQMLYKPAKNSTKDFYQTKETPVTVGLGLYIHKKQEVRRYLI